MLAPDYPLHSARVALRPLSEADIDAMVAYRSLEEVCRYLPFGPMDAAAARRRLAEAWSRTILESEGDALILGVELTASGELIGDVMLRWASEIDRAVEIGYVLNPRFSGAGLATEAAHRILHLAFDDLGAHRAFARLDAENTASARLLSRLGMRREAHLVENEWVKGRWSDELVYAMLEQEWCALDHAGCHPGPI